MKQRIRVVSIVKKGDEFLLLKRSSGRVETEPIWEIPTGKINFGEQPEEAITRAIDENIGVMPSKVALKDVITFVALTNASRLYNLYIVYEMTIPEDSKITLSDRYTQYKFLKPDSEALAGMKLDEATLSTLEIELGVSNRTSFAGAPIQSEYRSAANGATVYFDGASRGNPGPSAIGYYIIDQDGNELKRGGEFIGFATSRVAEYYALKEGCEQALELGLKSVRFVSDNLMLVNQLNGIYKVKNNDLLPIFNDVKNLLSQFEAVAFVHVRRDFNREADEQANLAIDRHFDENVL